MRLENLTPHDITIGKLDGNNKFQLIRTIPPNTDKKIARVRTEVLPCDPIDGVAVNAIRFLEVQDLPPPQEGVRYLVSMPVAQFAQNRDDLLCPYSEKAFREGARILGVPGLVRYESAEMKLSPDEKISVTFKKIENVSFQPVNIGKLGEDGQFQQTRVIPKSGPVAMVDTQATESEAIDDIPLFSVKFRGVKDLPSKEEGVIYIVPMPVAQYSGRTDCYAADTERAIRSNGNIVGFPGIVRYIQ